MKVKVTSQNCNKTFDFFADVRDVPEDPASRDRRFGPDLGGQVLPAAHRQGRLRDVFRVHGPGTPPPEGHQRPKGGD